MLRPRGCRKTRGAATLLLLAAVVLPVAGCGNGSSEGKLLSRHQASELRVTLGQVEADVAAHNCTGASERIGSLRQQIDGINRLDRGLRSSLRASLSRLETLVGSECQTTTTTPTETAPTTDTGASGATGPESESKKEKKPKKEKAPKEDSTPPGQDGQTPPEQQNGGGGAGVPGESQSNGTGD
jgi:hypothetical protein